MQQEQLNRAFNRGLVVHFASKEEQYQFMKEVKSFGGRWINGDEIVLPEKPQDLEDIFNLHINRDYELGIVSAMCYHFGVYPTIEYGKFKTDKATVDTVPDIDFESYFIIHTEGNNSAKLGRAKTLDEARATAQHLATQMRSEGRKGTITVEKNSKKYGRIGKELFENYPI